MWEVTYDNKKLPILKKPLFIEGLPGIGNVGKIVVDYLVEEFGAKKLCSFYSHHFPHSVFVNEKNLVEMPVLELYYKSFGTRSKKPDLIFLVGDIQPIDEVSTHAFCDILLSILQDLGCQEMITTGGIGLQQVPSNPKVYVTANSATLLKSYTAKGLGVQKNIHGVVGPILGVSGVLLGLGKYRNMKGVALLAETFAHPLYVGIKGSHALLAVIEKKLSLGLNLKKIKKEITQVMEAEKELALKTKEIVSEMVSAGANAKGSDPHYIG